jgi:hypothetical protein
MYYYSLQIKMGFKTTTKIYTWSALNQRAGKCNIAEMFLFGDLWGIY